MIVGKIIVPLLNANEPEARVVDIAKKNGEEVNKEDILFTIETTKATSEIISPNNGFFHTTKQEGDSVSAGDIIAVLTDTPDEKIAHEDIESKKSFSTGEKKKEINRNQQNLRITNRALKLANSLGIDLDGLPSDRLITEAMINEFVVDNEPTEIDLSKIKNQPILIYGGGGHSKTIIDLLRQLDDYTIVGVIDDNPALSKERILDVPVLGTRARLPLLRKAGIKYAVNCVGGILDINIRMRITNVLKQEGFIIAQLIHPSVIVEPSAKILPGAQILANSYIGSDASIGEDTIINTNSVISHDCTIGEHTHIAPGAILAGNVKVGERTLVGMGVTTSIGISIGSNVRIGNGSILLADVPDHTIIQAGRYWVGKA